jgi:hypothetical protein
MMNATVSVFDEFRNPSSQYRSKPFWAWNGKLQTSELRRQIRVMRTMGMGGFFMHSRVGLQTAYLSDEWFHCISACIDEATAQGMEAWLYDEDRWPSGAAGGLVTKHPEYRARYLELSITRPQDFAWSGAIIAAFAARVKGACAYGVRKLAEGTSIRLARGESILAFRVKACDPSDWYNGYTYADLMNYHAVKRFIQVTHEQYRQRFGRHFGKTVPGIFTDEPNVEHGDGLSWTDSLPAVFRIRYGYDLLDHLVELFFDVDGEPVAPARYHYHDCVTFLLAHAFSKQIGDWCRKASLMHTGHVLGESPMSNQAQAVGSAMRFYEHMQAPGIDILTEYWREFDTVKQATSVARQFGRKWRLSETYGATGWDFPLLGHKALGDWQTALGINLRCQHLAWYTMEGQAKRDYPGSISYQSPWWKAYRKVEDYFARINSIMSRGREVRDLLVIHPIESAWTMRRRDWKKRPAVTRYNHMLVALRDSILAANIDFDYGDEDILARHGKVKHENGSVVLTVAKARYKVVLVPPLVTMRGSTLDLLERFRRSGGEVVFAGTAPDYVDAQKSTRASEFALRCSRSPSRGPRLAKSLEKRARRVSITDRMGKEIVQTLHLLREDADACYLFVANTGHDFRKRVCDICVHERADAFGEVYIRGFGGCQGKPIELDPDTGARFLADARPLATGWEIRTSLPALGSRLFLIPKKPAAHSLRARPQVEILKTIELNPLYWPIALTEPNVAVLDMPEHSSNNGEWHGRDDILRIDEKVRLSMNLKPRGGTMVQPWTRQLNKNLPSAPLQLRYGFTLTALPDDDFHLALERPELYSIEVNGQPLRHEDNGWWVDKSLRKLRLSRQVLKRGLNSLVLTTNYNEAHPGLEICYILGNFGCVIKDGQVVLTSPVRSLQIGDWCSQGLPFYSGAVRYLCKLPPKPSKSHRLLLQVPQYDGACVLVHANGRNAGIIAWEPNEVDLTRFAAAKEGSLTIEVISHRRNSHGPLHLSQKRPEWTGPFEFLPNHKDWKMDYTLVPNGLKAPPRLIVTKNLS